MQISETVIQGFTSYEQAQKELSAIEPYLARERSWYKDAKRYADLTDLLSAIACQELVKFEGDQNIRLNLRFRNPKNIERYPSYLSQKATDRLIFLGECWRKAADNLGVSKMARLAVTSLTRTEEYQTELIKRGKLAVKDSTHLSGNAFDIDLAGYYLDLDNGLEASVSLREPSRSDKLAEAFRQEYGVCPQTDIVRLGPEYFDPNVPYALRQVAAKLHADDLINAVYEFEGDENNVLHIASSPY